MQKILEWCEKRLRKILEWCNFGMFKNPWNGALLKTILVFRLQDEVDLTNFAFGNQ